jgi:hypothetical protein
MNTAIKFPRLTERPPMPVEDKPPQQETYAPEVLPAFDDLQNFANHLAHQARSISNSGQLMVKDHRYTLDLLRIEADTLEQDRATTIQAIYNSYDVMVNDINNRFDNLLARNQAMQQKTEAMIGYFTNEPPPPVGVLEVQPRKRKTLLGFMVK